MVKLKGENAKVIATDEYKTRVSMADNGSLFITAVTLADQKTFTCMDVAGITIDEYPINVVVFSECKLSSVLNSIAFIRSALQYCLTFTHSYT